MTTSIYKFAYRYLRSSLCILFTFLGLSSSLLGSSSGIVSWSGHENSDFRHFKPPFKAVAASTEQSFVINHDGTLAGAGRNPLGMPFPRGLRNVIAIGGGNDYGIALTADGTVTYWGTSFGVDTVGFKSFVDIASIFAGESSVYGIKKDGTVVAVSTNSRYMPQGLAGVVQIAPGSTVDTALKADGTVVAWGAYGDQLRIPQGLTQVKAIASGAYHTLALKQDGTVIAWGSNSSGQCDVPSDISDVVSIAASDYCSFALKSDGTLVVWGKNGSQQQDLARKVGALTSVNAGKNHLVAIKQDGSITGWKYDLTGYAPLPVLDRDIKSIVFPFALTNDGKVINWGMDPSHPQAADIPEGLTNVVAITSAPDVAIALKEDGTVVAWGKNPWIPEDLWDVRAIQAGPKYRIALRGDGSVVIWGEDGKLLAAPYGIENVTAVGVGFDHLLALRSDGVVAAWGYTSQANFMHQCDVPADLGSVKAIAAGPYHSAALKEDGTLVTWGDYYEGQAPPPPADLKDIVAISAGGGYTLALKNDGTLSGWGAGWGAGSEIPPPGLVDVIAINAHGSYYSAVIKSSSDVPPVAVTGEAVKPSGKSVTLTGIVSTDEARVDVWFEYGERLRLVAKAVLVPTDDGKLSASATVTPPTPNANVSYRLVAATAAAIGEGDVRNFVSNAAPIATDDHAKMQWSPESPSVTINVLANDTDADAELLTITSATQPAHGIVHVDSGSKTLTYTPAENFRGSDSFTYTVADQLSSSTANVSILVEDPAPNITSQPQSTTVHVNGQLLLTVKTDQATFASYQWKKNGEIIPGATSATLILPTVSTSDHGDYTVVVTTPGGSIETTPATVDIRQSPSLGRSTYHAFVSGADVLKLERLGFLSINASVLRNGTGTFSGKLNFGGLNVPLRGILTAEGEVLFSTSKGKVNQLQIARLFLPPLSLSLDWFNKNGNNIVVGTLTDGTATWLFHASETASRSGAPPQAGLYTIAFPADTATSTDEGDARSLPLGNGYATATIDECGNVAVKGKLGSGTPFSSGTPLHQVGNTFWIYTPLRSGKISGTLAGEIAFDEEQEGVLYGTLRWIESAPDDAVRFQEGFDAIVDAEGSRFTPSAPRAADQRPLTFGASGLLNVTISGGDLLDPITASLPISSRNVVTPIAPLKQLSLSKTKGTFTGKFLNANGKTRTFNGVLLQKQNTGYGFSLGPTQSSSVVVTPASN